MLKDALSWAALIPAYNCAGTIGTVIRQVSKYIPPGRILVIDDGSTDETAEEVRETEAGLLHHAVNSGKGAALRGGFARILQDPVDWIVCLDADGQHDPDIIPEFQRAAATEQFELLIGDRSRNFTGMPFSRQFSNRTSSALLSRKTGLRISDAQCGYRAIHMELLTRMQLRSERYEIEVEMILEAARLQARIGWIPIPTIYRGEVSYLRKVPETIRFLKLLFHSYHE